MVSTIDQLARAHCRPMPSKEARQSRIKARRQPPHLVAADDGLGWDTTYYAADNETIKSIASAAQLDPTAVSANNGLRAVNARLSHNTGVFLPTSMLQWAQQHYLRSMGGGCSTPSTSRTVNSCGHGSSVNTGKGCSPTAMGGTTSSRRSGNSGHLQERQDDSIRATLPATSRQRGHLPASHSHSNGACQTATLHGACKPATGEGAVKRTQLRQEQCSPNKRRRM